MSHREIIQDGTNANPETKSQQFDGDDVPLPILVEITPKIPVISLELEHPFAIKVENGTIPKSLGTITTVNKEQSHASEYCNKESKVKINSCVKKEYGGYTNSTVEAVLSTSQSEENNPDFTKTLIAEPVNPCFQANITCVEYNPEFETVYRNINITEGDNGNQSTTVDSGGRSPIGSATAVSGQFEMTAVGFETAANKSDYSAYYSAKVENSSPTALHFQSIPDKFRYEFETISAQLKTMSDNVDLMIRPCYVKLLRLEDYDIIKESGVLAGGSLNIQDIENCTKLSKKFFIDLNGFKTKNHVDAKLLTACREQASDDGLTTHCDNSFIQKSSLPKCTRRNKGKTKPFICAHCNKRFPSKCNLKTHIRIHTGEKPFSCSQCNWGFCQKNDLVSHIRTHTGEKPFGCSHCKKRFMQQGSLSRHVKRHTGEKPHACNICGKGFVTKTDLKYHVLEHTGDKPFRCSECDQGFRQRILLTNHMRIHTGELPFACSQCDERFISKKYLASHAMKHSKEKPFSCSLCKKRFCWKSDVKVHMRIHTGVKPFSCPLCNKQFSVKSNLSQHIKRTKHT